MHKMTGFNLTMCYNLIKDYNPEMIEKLKVKMNVNFGDVVTSEFYDAKNLFAILNEFSPAAQEVIGKQIIPSLNKMTWAFDGITDPVQIFKMLPQAYVENNIDGEGGDIGNWLDVKKIDEEKYEVRENTIWPGDFNRGILIGIVQLVAGVKRQIRVSTEVIEDKEKGYPT